MTVMFTAVLTALSAQDPERGPAMAFTAIMIAGLVQMAIGAMKLGSFITLMPYSVISGFMSGIGVLLIFLQIPSVLGQKSPGGGAWGVLMGVPELIQGVVPGEAAIALLALALLWGWPQKWRKYCPPPLLALVVTTLVSLLWSGFDGVRRVGEIPMGLPNFQMPTLRADLLSRMVLDGLVLGLLGCIDTLLTAMIADSLTREHHDSDRELMGQGLANLISGLCGGLPGAGATMGTVVNIQTGARTRRSGVIRSLLLLLPMLGAAPLFKSVPMAALSAIALKVGMDILDWSFLKRVHRVSRSSTFMMWIVLLLTVFVDLILAVGIGVFIANLLTIKRLSDLHSRSVRAISIPDAGLVLPPEENELMERAGEKLLLFHLSGPMIFGVAKAIAREHAAMRHAKVLVIDLTDVPLLGVTVALSIENMILDALAQQAKVWVAGASGGTKERLANLGLLTTEGVREAGSRVEALRQAVGSLGS